ncbi:MAG: glycosyltransferase [Herpetosiphonaceae bacterium]|nr:glycosyltransferase [Herpetosiphonaceae bacterium]
MAKLAILSPMLPYPALAGGTVHINNAVLQLSKYYATRLYALSSDPAAAEWGPLAEVCAETVAFAPTPRRGLGLAPPAVRQEYSSGLIAHLERAWAAEPPDVVMLEFTSMAQYALLARRFGATVVCTAHNVAFLSQIRRARMQRGLGLKARRWLGALSLWLYELRTLRHCDLVVTHSDVDRAALRRWLPRTRIEYVPSGVDLTQWPICRDAAATPEVLFVGNYFHPPNVEGAEWLAREVWPLVRQQCPAARLTLAGRAPSAAIQALAAPDIQVPGTVDDLHDLYRQSSVVVAPIFWGSGVRIKILEALACGLPLVTTALAAEGIDLVDQHSAVFAETPAAFAAAIVQLLSDQAVRARIGAAGRRVVERDYDWRQVGARLAALYEEVRGSGFGVRE